MEPLESRALLTASTDFASCEWVDTLPECYWMATCQAAESCSSDAAPAVASSGGPSDCVGAIKGVGALDGCSTVCVDEQPVCVDSQSECIDCEPVCAVKEPICAGSESECIDCEPVCEEKERVCIDSKSNCSEGEANYRQKNCEPTPPCQPVPKNGCAKSDCQEQPSCEELRRTVYEKIATLLRMVSKCRTYCEKETPSNCGSTAKQATFNRSESSCNTDSSSSCETPKRGCYDQAEVCRIVDSCFSDTSWTASAA